LQPGKRERRRSRSGDPASNCGKPVAARASRQASPTDALRVAASEFVVPAFAGMMLRRRRGEKQARRSAAV
jgi:hypothetical protein